MMQTTPWRDDRVADKIWQGFDIRDSDDLTDDFLQSQLMPWVVCSLCANCSNDLMNEEATCEYLLERCA